MNKAAKSPKPRHVNRLPVRVRYPEADPMGRLHHSRLLVYFEMGRTEYMRERGVTYAEMEKAGHFITVVSAEVKYRAPAAYDDMLVVETWVEEVRGARVFFGNRVVREGGPAMAQGVRSLTDRAPDPVHETVIAEALICGALLGADGRPRRFSDADIALMCGPPRQPRRGPARPDARRRGREDRAARKVNPLESRGP